MEKRVTVKAAKYIDEFKQSILNKLNQQSDTNISELCEYIQSYDNINFELQFKYLFI